MQSVIDVWIDECVRSNPYQQIEQTDCAIITEDDLSGVLLAIKNVGKGWVADEEQWFAPIAQSVRKQMTSARIHVAAKTFFLEQIVKRFETSICCAHEAWGSAAVLGTLAAGMQQALSQFHHTGIGSMSTVCNITIQHALQPKRMPPMMCVYLDPSSGVQTEDPQQVIELLAGKLEYRQLNDFVLSTDVIKAIDMPHLVACVVYFLNGLRCCRQVGTEFKLFELSQQRRNKMLGIFSRSMNTDASADAVFVRQLSSYTDSGLSPVTSVHTKFSYNPHSVLRCVRYIICPTALYVHRQSLSQLAMRIELNMPGCIVYPHIRDGAIFELFAMVPSPILKANATFQTVQHLHTRNIPRACTAGSGQSRQQWIKFVRSFISQRHFQLCASVNWSAQSYALQDDSETFMDIEREAFIAASPSTQDPLMPKCSEGVLCTSSDEMTPLLLARTMELVNGCPAVQPLLNYLFLVQQIQRRSLFIAICGVPAIRRVTMCRSIHPDTKAQEWMAVTDGSDMHALLTLSATQFPQLDTRRSFSTVLEQMQSIFGIEATLQLLRKATSVDPAMLNIILSQLAHRGDMLEGLSRTTVLKNLKGAVASMTFECPTVYAREAAIKGGFDNMDSIVSNLMVGNVVPVGTGMVDVRLKPTAFEDVPLAANNQRYTTCPDRRPIEYASADRLSVVHQKHEYDLARIMADLQM